MRVADANRCIRAPGRNQDLHGEELREDQILTSGIARFPALRKMNGASRLPSRTMNQAARRNRFQFWVPNFIQQSVNDAAQNALRKTFRLRIYRRDAPKMDRNFFIIFDDLEFRMIHANPLSPQTRFAKDD